jgi:tRNA threonylcarbamoyladenosine biosynthesis protein TsaB
MALILSIETALDVCAVAIHENGNLVRMLEVREPRSHAAQLALLIREVCKQSSHSLSHMQAIAVSAGPGSYTGLRIGVSTAKGLCYGLNIPLISVDTLDVIAQETRQHCPAETWVCPMIDARRMDVFYKLIDERHREVLQTSATTLHPLLFRDYLDQGITICFSGNAIEKCKTVVQHPRALFIPGIYPRVSVLGELAHSKWIKGITEDPARFEPVYAKEFFTTAKG